MTGWRFVCARGPAVNDEWVLAEGQEVLIGRGSPEGDEPRVDVGPDERVSRRHARVWGKSGQLWIEDLGSRHGTSVDGRPIRGLGPVELIPGDLIELGDTSLRLASPNWHRFRNAAVTIALELAPVYGYALAHAGCPLIRRLVVRNTGPESSAATTLSIGVEGLGEPVSVRLDVASPGESREYEVPCRAGASVALEEQTERRHHALHLALDGVRLDGPEIAITSLAHNEWSVADAHREYLASFVLPNHPLVQQLTHDALHTLPSDSRSADVLEAVYTHLATTWNLAYRLEPPGSASDGQKVRLPHQVLLGYGTLSGAGTCLDLAVLIAACLEQARVQPLIALFNGRESRHAIVGCWDRPRASLEPLLGDTARLSRGAVWLDPTGCARDGALSLSFEDAREAAMRCMRNDELLFGLDVAAARADGIEPLPLAGTPRLGDPAKRAIEGARSCAEARPTLLGTVPLLIGILSLADGVGRRVVQELVRDPEAVIQRLRAGLPVQAAQERPSRNFNTAVDLATARAKAEGSPVVLERHLLLSLLELPSASLGKALEAVGINPQEFARAVRHDPAESRSMAQEYTSMSRFLTEG